MTAARHAPHPVAADPIKVYDARWEVHEFDDAQVRRLFEAALAYGRELGVDTVTLTRDGRLGAPHVLELGVEAAVRLGFRTYACFEPVSTPHGYYASLHVSAQHPRTMGLVITASHNPRQYIGVKFTVPVVQAIGLDCGPQGGLTRVRALYHAPEPPAARRGGTLHRLDLGREYVAYSLEQAGVRPGTLAGLRVVLDGLHGSAGPEVLAALTAAGVLVEPLRLVPDGHFPTGSPNPTSHGKMDAAVRRAGECGAHAVIGLDGDGDRIVFGDRRGVLTAGFAFVPILRACLAVAGADRPPPVLYDPKVSPLALAEWGRLGAAPLLFRNGHSQIKDYMARQGALAAAEESGHYYHRLTRAGLTISGENSLVTILLFLDALRRDPGLLDELWRLQGQAFTTGEFNYQFDNDATRDRARAALVERLASDGATIATATPDGIDLQGTCVSRGVALVPGHVQLAPGWYSGYLRPATNEKSVLRAYFSAGDEASGRRIEQQARALLGAELGGRVIE